MKANVWTSGKFRIVERFNKVTAVSTFDVQFKSIMCGLILKPAYELIYLKIFRLTLTKTITNF